MIGSFNMDSNGKSYMNFYMDMSIVTFRQNNIEKTTQVGSWQAGLDGNVTFSNENVLSNFTSTQIYRVVVVEQPPFVYIAKLAPRGYRGYCIDMMDMIAEALGFDYEIQLATGNKMGDMDDNGRWDGMMKDLIDKKADIGLGSISVMAERESFIDFTVPYYDLVGYSILMKTSYVPPSIYKFLTVLEDDVWISIIVAYFITSFLLWAFDKYSPNSYQNNPGKYEDEDDKRIFTMKESLWFCMTSLTPQGGGDAPKQLSGRLVAATWWLFGFIIIASYTANLAAFLTVSRLEHTIESLDDLYKQYRVTYAPVNGSNAMIYFQRMSNIEDKFYEIWKEMSLNDSLSNLERSKLAVWDYPISDKFSKIWQIMQDSGLPSSLTEAVAKVRASKSATSGFAFIADATDVKYQELISCDLVAVGDEFSRKPYALAVQQGSPLKNRLNGVILDLMNRRKLESLRKKWWENNPERMECPDPENPSEGISMRNIGGVFILIIIGIGMAIGILSLEYYLYHREKEIKIIGVRDIVDGTQMYTGSAGKTSLKRIE
ncbi:hypothetical protein WA026_007381 [Henosepilachna vigintioctopunctata]|uniref:Uncharacterized protein n=1 Tax=Henosepilachna vigintioctopunctata TaxID=420089 RepID=A0AAW1UX51_9CUCU